MSQPSKLSIFFNPLDLPQQEMCHRIDQYARAIDGHLTDPRGAATRAFDLCEAVLEDFPGEPTLYIRKIEAIRQARFLPRFSNRQSRESLSMLTWLATQPYSYTVSNRSESIYFNNMLHYYRDTGMAWFEFDAATAAHAYFPADPYFRSLHERAVRRRATRLAAG